MVRYIEEENEAAEEQSLTLKEPPPSAYLTLLVSGRLSHTFPLRGEVQLGREKTNAIVVADQKVSRHHAVLTPIDNTFIVHDQGSANGTYVNGVRIGQPTRLQNNDKIRIGDASFLFTTGQPDPQTLNPPFLAPAVPLTVQPAGSSPVSFLSDNNRPIWLVIGCMALAIVALLLLLAVILGLFIGRNQIGLALLWLMMI